MGNKQQLARKTQSAYIEKFSHDGRGIARINGKTTFIAGALPGETVSFVYLKIKKTFDEGQTTTVVDASDKRVTPRCMHFKECGGCSLQHLQEEIQIQEKQALLLDLLQRIAHLKPQTILAPLKSASWHYRSKARLSVTYLESKKTVMLGFRQKNNPQMIADIKECPVLHLKVAAHLEVLKQVLSTLEDPKKINYVEIAAGDDEQALVFNIVKPLTEQDRQKIRQFGLDYNFSIFLQAKNLTPLERLYSPSDLDLLTYTLPTEGLKFNFCPTDFTQVNPALNRLMITQALTLMALKSTDVVLDLFCGLGNFSLPLAQQCAQVIGIEGSKAMVARASANATLNNITNAQFYCADLNQSHSLQQLPIPLSLVNKVLIDPPRVGALDLVKQLATLNLECVVYASCDPATLARDSDILVNQLGYVLKATGVMDMFPHTAHVESIALFEKG